MTEIRRAAVDDARAIAELHVETWRAAYREVLPKNVLDALDVDARERMWCAATTRADPGVFVAERAGEVVGFVSVGPARGSAGGELYAIYVRPEAWGSGAGSALMRAALAWLAERYEEAILWVAENNPRARAFYERWGWTVDTSRIDEVEGVELPEVRYRLSGLSRL